MQVKAKLNHLRIAPRKVRLVADLIRGLPVSRAEKQLKFLTKQASLPLERLLKSAVANAESNAKLVKDNLYIAKITVDGGPIIKRWRARAHGRAAEIMKRTSHITLVLDELKPGLRQKKAKGVKKGTKEVEKEKELSETVSERKQKEKTAKKPYQEDKKIPDRSGAGKVKRFFRRKSM